MFLYSASNSRVTEKVSTSFCDAFQKAFLDFVYSAVMLFLYIKKCIQLSCQSYNVVLRVLRLREFICFRKLNDPISLYSKFISPQSIHLKVLTPRSVHATFFADQLHCTSFITDNISKFSGLQVFAKKADL